MDRLIGTGRLDRGDLLVDRGNVLHDEAERKQCKPGQSTDDRDQGVRLPGR
jgi:hypothetical protein